MKFKVGDKVKFAPEYAGGNASIGIGTVVNLKTHQIYDRHERITVQFKGIAGVWYPKAYTLVKVSKLEETMND